MNAGTTVSAEGQVLIPKDVRERLGWSRGAALELAETGGGVLLRLRSDRGRLSVAEATERLRAIYRHKGPPVPIERLSWSADVDDPERDRR